MRIIGYIEHPILKITIFKMDNKISVKLESGLYEQTYKFRDSEHLQGVEGVKKLVDADFCKEVLQLFNWMHTIQDQAFARAFPQQDDMEFEEII